MTRGKGTAIARAKGKEASSSPGETEHSSLSIFSKRSFHLNPACISASVELTQPMCVEEWQGNNSVLALDNADPNDMKTLTLSLI